MRGLVICWMLIGVLGFLIFPWYVTGDGFFSINWILEYSLEDYGSVLPQVFINKKYWLLPILLPLVFPLATLKLNQNNPLYSKIFLYSGIIGFIYFFLQGFSIGIRGWNFEILQSIFLQMAFQPFLRFHKMFTICKFIIVNVESVVQCC